MSTRTRRAPRHTLRHTPRQLDLLDRLVELMAAEGFAHLTLDDVASRLHCSKTTLYAIAPSRPELVVAVVERYFHSSYRQVEAAIGDANGPAARVEAYLEAVAACLAPLSRRFMDDLSDFGPASEVYRDNTRAAADRIRGLIADGVESGVFRRVHVDFTGEMVAATMFEIQRGEMFGRLSISDSEAYRELASLLLGALEP